MVELGISREERRGVNKHHARFQLVNYFDDFRLGKCVQFSDYYPFRLKVVRPAFGRKSHFGRNQTAQKVVDAPPSDCLHTQCIMTIGAP